MTTFKKFNNERKQIDFDYHQEVANTGFGDMLHDCERNEKYYAALQIEISRMKENGQAVHVLDIGTGTGLLAMMAAKLGADTVTACERFRPMADCAEDILKLNHMHDKVRLIKKSSYDLKIGVDMPQRANLLVTELLDTELIGEGALRIYNHAHAELLTDNAVCIPAKAICYATLTHSPMYTQWNRLKLIADDDGNILLKTPPNIETCRGISAMHDMQVSQLRTDLVLPLAKPIVAFEFDFSSKTPLALNRQRAMPVKCLNNGRADVVIFWWDIQMSCLTLTCAPFWAQSAEGAEVGPNTIPWREHWMQAFYYLPQPLHVVKGADDPLLICCHDEFSWWFDIRPGTEAPSTHLTAPACTCYFHLTHSRNRIGLMNDLRRTKQYLRFIEGFLAKPQDAHVLTLGDSCMLGLTFAKFGCGKVFCYEPQRLSHDFMQSIVKMNELTQVFVLHDSLSADELKKITHIFAEPFFHNSQLPWDNFYFGYMLLELQSNLLQNVQVSPYGARVYALPMSFFNLHKLHTPVGKVLDFDLTPFDEMVQKSKDKTVPQVEPHALWEYPGTPLAKPYELFTVNFRCFGTEINNEGVIPIERIGELNGIALWVDWVLDDKEKFIISTGPVLPVNLDSHLQWNMYVQQGVFFMPKSCTVDPRIESRVHFNIVYKPHSSQLDFKFKLSP